MPNKISIIGAGMVGSTFAYKLLDSDIASKVVLIDVNQARAEAEALDMSHSSAIDGGCQVESGTFSDMAGSKYVVITAGTTMKPGQTRMDLIEANAKIMQNIIKEVSHYAPEAFLIIASNPLDVMTYAAWKYSGYDLNKVIGSGNVLDSARFRYYLSQRLDCRARDLFAYTLGEHGDSQVGIFSKVSIKGMPLDEYCDQFKINFTEADQLDVIKETINSAYIIKEGKGHTYYGIGTALMRIIKAIELDQRSIQPVSTVLTGQYGFRDVCMSLPTILGKNGVEKVLTLELDEKEMSGLTKSYESISEYTSKLSF